MNLLPQIRNNLVALISLCIAIFSVFYAGWRDNRIEEHRNIRVAGFEVLKNLGELQMVVDYAHYQKDRQLGNPITGWGRVLLVRDLAQVMPDPAPQAAERVFQSWQNEWESVADDEAAAKRVSDEIAGARKIVLEVLATLE
ncbi:MAG: hypothetical protein ACREV9_03660 [Burkholderiales bacterium]